MKDLGGLIACCTIVLVFTIIGAETQARNGFKPTSDDVVPIGFMVAGMVGAAFFLWRLFCE